MKHKRVIVTHYGGPESIQIIEEQCPDAKAGEARIRVLNAGVSLPDIMARQGIHPETPRVPFTPGWDLVGVVDQLGDGVTDVSLGQVVAAMPIHGAYAEYVCLPQNELVPVPQGVDSAEAVCIILNYITAYQMLHHTAKVQQGQKVLIHGASGGVGTALLQLGRLSNLHMFASCSAKSAQTVSELGAIPIDYRQNNVEEEVLRLTGDGVDFVFDPLGAKHTWLSRKVLRRGGKVVGYGSTTSPRGKGLASDSPGKRNRLHGVPMYLLYMLGGVLFPGKKRISGYSIQTLKRLNPKMFRRDLTTLLDLLKQQKIHPIVARHFPLSDAKKAQELLEKGGTIGKIVLDVSTMEVKSKDTSAQLSAKVHNDELHAVIDE